jgi:ADP-ribosylglycohydrolase
MVMFAKNCSCPNGGYGEMFYIWLFMPWSLKEICPKAFDDDFFPKYDSPDGRVPYNSWGNGSAMRVSAVGWFFETLEETERVAKISAEITHNHPEGIKGAQATAAAIWMARNGKSKADIKEYIETKYEYDLDRTWEYLNQRYGWKSSCQETVPEAIIAFLESSSFEDAIRKAVSMGGDSDTLACITGGIAEAFYGEIPEEMILETKRVFPQIFHKILDAMKINTAYGKQNK